MNPTVPRAGKPCANPACRRWFRAISNQHRQKFCGRACAAVCRPRASRVAAGKKGGTASGVRRRGISLDAIAQRVQDMSPIQAFQIGRYYAKTDSFNRAQTARREGFSDGYERGYDAAMKELRRDTA
jgi:hypothetical protein